MAFRKHPVESEIHGHRERPGPRPYDPTCGGPVAAEELDDDVGGEDHAPLVVRVVEYRRPGDRGALHPPFGGGGPPSPWGRAPGPARCRRPRRAPRRSAPAAAARCARRGGERTALPRHPRRSGGWCRSISQNKFETLQKLPWAKWQNYHGNIFRGKIFPW